MPGRPASEEVRGKILVVDDAAPADDEGVLDRVLQLPDVAGPGVGDELVQGLLGDAGHVLFDLGHILGHEVARQ